MNIYTSNKIQTGIKLKVSREVRTTVKYQAANKCTTKRSSKKIVVTMIKRKRKCPQDPKEIATMCKRKRRCPKKVKDARISKFSTKERHSRY